MSNLTVVRFGQGTATHAGTELGSLCGAEVTRAAGSCITKTRKGRLASGPVTCKRCCKTMALQGIKIAH